MSDRFCSRCNAEVEDAGGFCLLGHPLSESAPTGSLADLRAEVDRAFEEARVKVGHVLTQAPPPPPPSVPSAPGPTTVFPRIEEPALAGPDPIAEFAPAARMDWGPERRQGLRKRFE